MSPYDSYGWSSLGHTMSGHDTVVISGTIYTNLSCYVKSLEINPDDSNTWHCLGDTFKARSVTVNGHTYTHEACHLKGAACGVWACVKNQLDTLWEKMGMDDAYSPSSDYMSDCYAKVAAHFTNGNSCATHFICRPQRYCERSPPGALDLWFDGILQGIGDADFTETLRRLGHIVKIAKFVDVILPESRHPDIKNHLQKALVCSAFFAKKRSWFLESCFALISTRSGYDTDLVFKVLRFVSIRTYVRLPDGKLQVDGEGIRVETSLAPIIKNGYIRALQVLYSHSPNLCVSAITTTHPGIDMNDAFACFTKQSISAADLREVCVREMALACQRLGLDRTEAQGMMHVVFEKEIKTNLDNIDTATSLSILEPLCAAYPSPDAEARLKMAYRSVRDSDEYAIEKRTPCLEDKFCKLFEKRLRSTINDYTIPTLSNAPSYLEFSNGVGLAFDHFNQIVTQCFEQFGGFTTKLCAVGKAALQTFKADEKKKQLSLERCLSIDVDRTVTGKNPEKSEDEIILRLSRISAVVAFLLTAQDEFDQAHCMYLEDRLLSNRNDEKQRKYDRKFLEIVHGDDARFDVKFASRLINDIEKSEETVKRLGKLHASIERPLLISSTVFSTTNRNMLGGVFITPAGEIKTILDDLRSAFLGHTSISTTMCWLNFKGVASLKAVVEAPDGKAPSIITYNMTIAQAALLMHIQDCTFAGTPVTWGGIATQCWEKDGLTSLKENLGDLMNTKRSGCPTVPLIKPSNAKFDHTTTLMLNNQFPTNKNTVHFAFQTRSSSNDEDCIELSRVEKIKVCVVRYMKANQRADYNTLLGHVKAQAPTLRIPEPSASQFKKALDKLMCGAEQYIRRDEVDNRTFVYIA